MKSDEYWRKREEAARKNRITDEKEMRRQIDAINQRMIDECNAQIDAWLQRYADKDGITLQEAKKRVSRLDIAEYERYARELVQRGSVMRRSGKKVSYGDFSDEENEQMRIYNLTMKINRLEMLKSRIGLQTTAGYAEMRNYLGDKLTDAAMAESERQAGILGGIVNMNAKEASSIVNASFKGATFSQRLWKNQQELQSSLDRSLTSALIQGWGSAKVARQIRKNFAGDFKKAGKAAMRLAVTELARVEIGAQQESFNRLGFKQYTFLAVGPHPCDVCQALDGKHFNVDDMVPGENAPPMHPYCHCSVAAYSDRSDYDEWLDSGAAADGVPFEDYKVEFWKERGREFTKRDSSAIIESSNFREQSRYNPGDDERALVSDVVEKDEYKDRMKALGEPENITNILLFQSRKTLWRRNGTPFEDLIYINAETGEVIAQRRMNEAGRVQPTEEMKALVLSNPGKIIAVHNHPHNMLPSLDDLTNASRYKYSIVICHDGTILKFFVGSNVDIERADVILDMMQPRFDAEDDLSNDLSMLDSLGVFMEVIR